MHTSKLKPQNCPACGFALSGVSNMTGNGGPQPGDYTVCIECGEPMRFDAEMTLAAVPMSQVPRELWPTFDTMRFYIKSRKQTTTPGVL